MLKCLYNSSQINDEDRLILINSWHHSCKNVKEIFTDVARKFREENCKNFCYDPWDPWLSRTTGVKISSPSQRSRKVTIWTSRLAAEVSGKTKIYICTYKNIFKNYDCWCFQGYIVRSVLPPNDTFKRNDSMQSLEACFYHKNRGETAL